MARAIFSLHTTTTRHKTHLQKEVLFLRCTFSNTQQRFLGVLLRVSVCVVLILFMFLCCVCFMLCFTFVVLCLMVIEIDLFFLCFCCFFLLSRWYFIPFYPFQPKFCCFLSPSTVFSSIFFPQLASCDRERITVLLPYLPKSIYIYPFFQTSSSSHYPPFHSPRPTARTFRVVLSFSACLRVCMYVCNSVWTFPASSLEQHAFTLLLLFDL